MSMKQSLNSRKAEINKNMKYITKEVKIGLAGIIALCIIMELIG